LTARQTSALDDEQFWVRVMQCLSCRGEMRLIAVAQDRQLSLPGYMHHTVQCAACNEVETRFLFSRELPVPVVPVAAEEIKRNSLWEQAIAKLRDHQVVLGVEAELRKASHRAAEFDRHWDQLCRARNRSHVRGSVPGHQASGHARWPNCAPFRVPSVKSAQALATV
jgi:hypothetical protein